MMEEWKDGRLEGRDKTISILCLPDPFNVSSYSSGSYYRKKGRKEGRKERRQGRRKEGMNEGRGGRERKG